MGSQNDRVNTICRVCGNTIQKLLTQGIIESLSSDKGGVYFQVTDSAQRRINANKLPLVDLNMGKLESGIQFNKAEALRHINEVKAEIKGIEIKESPELIGMGGNSVPIALYGITSRTHALAMAMARAYWANKAEGEKKRVEEVLIQEFKSKFKVGQKWKYAHSSDSCYPIYIVSGITETGVVFNWADITTTYTYEDLARGWLELVEEPAVKEPIELKPGQVWKHKGTLFPYFTILRVLPTGVEVSALENTMLISHDEFGQSLQLCTYVIDEIKPEPMQIGQMWIGNKGGLFEGERVCIYETSIFHVRVTQGASEIKPENYWIPQDYLREHFTIEDCSTFQVLRHKHDANIMRILKLDNKTGKIESDHTLNKNSWIGFLISAFQDNYLESFEWIKTCLSESEITSFVQSQCNPYSEKL